jgi:hypothetical protein
MERNPKYHDVAEDHANPLDDSEDAIHESLLADNVDVVRARLLANNADNAANQ